MINLLYSKTCHERPLKKKTKIVFSRSIIALFRSKVLQNAPGGHSAILSTFIKIFVLSIFEWLLKTGFTVFDFSLSKSYMHYRAILASQSKEVSQKQL